MRAGRRSRTAEGTAALRAIHQLLDGEPRVLEDEYASRMLLPTQELGVAMLPEVTSRLDLELRQRLAPWFRARRSIGVRRIRTQVVVRSRYTEDCLEAAMERGVSQYVILAAGLDTFALRRPELADRLRVFEVDHPASQEWKRERIDALGEGWPDHLTQVAIDFETESLAEVLEASDYDPSLPAFFSWLGLSYYLSGDAIREMLRFLATRESGSEMVFDYWTDRTHLAVSERALLESIRFGVQAQGEPMRSFFTPEEIDELLPEQGVSVVENLSPADLDSRYLDGRRDGLRLPGFAHLARVAVDG